MYTVKTKMDFNSMKQLPSKIVLALAFMCSCSYRKATLHKQSTLERREDSFNELPLERSSFHILKLHLKTLGCVKCNHITCESHSRMTSFIYRLLTQCNQVGAQIFSSRKLLINSTVFVRFLSFSL